MGHTRREIKLVQKFKCLSAAFHCVALDFCFQVSPDSPLAWLSLVSSFQPTFPPLPQVGLQLGLSSLIWPHPAIKESSGLSIQNL